MQSVVELPKGYRKVGDIDLQKQKKPLLLVNALAMLIGVVMLVLGFWLWATGETAATPTLTLGKPMLWKVLVAAVGLVAYLLLHEGVHGVLMHHYSGVKPRYGFTGLYAYAGSTAYFCRKHYLCIALSPVVVWGVVLLGLQCLVPRSWFWVVYAIQTFNLSGAAGDLYVTLRLCRQPDTLLVQDSGIAMQLFLPEDAPKSAA